MGALSDIRTIQEILSRHHFTFSKAMGQNFLINPSVCRVCANGAVRLRMQVC